MIYRHFFRPVKKTNTPDSLSNDSFQKPLYAVTILLDGKKGAFL